MHICCQPDKLDELQGGLVQFADLMDLALDMKKTYAWCVSATTVKSFAVRAFVLSRVRATLELTSRFHASMPIVFKQTESTNCLTFGHDSVGHMPSIVGRLVL